MATATDDPVAGTDDADPDAPVGTSIEDAAENQEPQQLPLPGTRPELSLTAGGTAPESASMKFRGGSVSVDGEFEKGAVVHAWVEMVVTEVHFVDKTNPDGHVTGTERRHIARVRRIQKT